MTLLAIWNRVTWRSSWNFVSLPLATCWLHICFCLMVYLLLAFWVFSTLISRVAAPLFNPSSRDMFLVLKKSFPSNFWKLSKISYLKIVTVMAYSILSPFLMRMWRTWLYCLLPCSVSANGKHCHSAFCFFTNILVYLRRPILIFLLLEFWNNGMLKHAFLFNLVCFLSYFCFLIHLGFDALFKSGDLFAVHFGSILIDQILLCSRAHSFV